TGDESKSRGLAGAGRPDEDDELAVDDREVQIVQRADAVGVSFADMFEDDLGHEEMVSGIESTSRRRRGQNHVRVDLALGVLGNADTGFGVVTEQAAVRGETLR